MPVQNTDSKKLHRSTYLLLSCEHVLDVRHCTVTHRRHIKLTFLGQDVVYVKLALHYTLKLTPGYSDLLLTMTMRASNASSACIQVIFNLVRISPLMLVLLLWFVLRLLLKLKARPLLISRVINEFLFFFLALL